MSGKNTKTATDASETTTPVDHSISESLRNAGPIVQLYGDTKNDVRVVKEKTIAAERGRMSRPTAENLARQWNKFCDVIYHFESELAKAGIDLEESY